MVEQLLDVKSKLAVPMRYLMGPNEPWSLRPRMSGVEAAHIWRLYLQPVAELTGLSLLSPTFTFNEMLWNRDFLVACFDLADADPPCDVESVAGFAIHEYDCRESFW